MAKKLLEKNGAEMAAALVNIAGAIEHLASDAQISETFIECTREGVRQNLHDMLKVYSNMAPLLLGKDHIKDTLAVVAEIEGTTVKELLEMNGTDLLVDIVNAWKEQIGPFFQRFGLSV